MGLGDQLLAAGKAKIKHKETGQIVSIGDGTRILWSPFFENNPYISTKPTGTWVIDYPGHRGYFTDKKPDRWVWNMDYRAEPAEIFLSDREKDQIPRRDYVLVEPHIKPGAPKSKEWRGFQTVVDSLNGDMEFIQPIHTLPPINGVTPVRTSLRAVCVLMAGAKAYLGPDGCLHHLAAAMNTPGCVIFGGFAPPEVTGYPSLSIFASGDPLGHRQDTPESRAAMDAITPDLVTKELEDILNARGHPGIHRI